MDTGFVSIVRALVLVTLSYGPGQAANSQCSVNTGPRLSGATSDTRYPGDGIGSILLSVKLAFRLIIRKGHRRKHIGFNTSAIFLVK